MNLQKETNLKLVILSCYLLFIFGVLKAHFSPAADYEASIYLSTPLSVWITIAIGLLSGYAICVHHIFRKEYNLTFYSSLLLIFMNIFLVLSLFIIRDYYAWGFSADPGTHIHYIMEIVNQGHINSLLFYPIMHIYSVEIMLLMGVDAVTVSKYLPFVFSILFYLFFYIMSRSILHKKEQVLLSLLAASTLIYGWNLRLTPNHLSNLMFPFLVYLVVKNLTQRNPKWKLLLLILIVLYPPFHPVPTMAFLIIAISLTPAYNMLLSLRNKSLSISEKNSLQKASPIAPTYIFVLIVWLFTWMSSFYVWRYTIQNLYSLLSESSDSNLDSLRQTIDYTSLYYNVYTEILKQYSDEIILLAILAAGLFIFHKKYLKDENYLLLLSFLVPLGLFGLSIFVFLLTNVFFGPLRFVSYIDMILILFFGAILWDMTNRAFYLGKKKNRNIIFPVVVLLMLAVIGISNTYTSPYLLEISDQTTHQEVDGMGWTFDHRDMGMKIADISIVQFRLGEVLLNNTEISENKVTKKQENLFRVPYHFGYNSSDDFSLGDHYPSDYYLVLCTKDYVLYEDIYPEMAPYRWYSSDFDKLQSDTNVWKVYNNGGYETLFIRGVEAS